MGGTDVVGCRLPLNNFENPSQPDVATPIHSFSPSFSSQRQASSLFLRYRYLLANFNSTTIVQAHDSTSPLKRPPRIRNRTLKHLFGSSSPLISVLRCHSLLSYLVELVPLCRTLKSLKQDDPACPGKFSILQNSCQPRGQSQPPSPGAAVIA